MVKRRLGATSSGECGAPVDKNRVGQKDFAFCALE